uniref:reticulon-1-A-like n=1 Tax=Agelaius phoeniceus TaxID=39638 RepID=UPI0023EBA2CD|nr:reticulon-1-A-like [Agelaius phoeniceus]
MGEFGGGFGGSWASPAPLPSPPPGGAPAEPPRASAPPPPPADQSASAAGADGQVWELLYWRVPHRSALALLVSLVLLGSLSRFSAVAVVAHAALAVLAVTVPLRLRQVALRALRPSTTESPARRTEPLSEEQQQRWARCLARHTVAAARTLTRLFLVHSVPESLKFAFLFYLLTYVGAACNGVTLLAAGVISAFTFPMLYRRHQAQIDQHLSLARSHLSHLRARVLAKLPSAKVKPQ